MGIREAKQAAQMILEDRWNKLLPVDVVSIAQSLGVGVFGINDDDSMLSGAYYPDHPGNNNRPTIIVNTKEPLPRQRFTMAHELGHHVLHGNESFRDPLHQIPGSDPKEIEANTFAANFLMPELQFRMLVESGNHNAASLAALLGVSMSALNIRLESLGYHA